MQENFKKSSLPKINVIFHHKHLVHPKKNVLISRSPNFNISAKFSQKWHLQHIGSVVFCDEEGENVEHLNETFRKETLAKDGENGEKWIGCMMCNQSFHVKCFLMNITQQEWDEGAKKNGERSKQMFESNTFK